MPLRKPVKLLGKIIQKFWLHSGILVSGATIFLMMHCYDSKHCKEAGQRFLLLELQMLLPAFEIRQLATSS